METYLQEMQEIMHKLSPQNQKYMITLARVAAIAEEGMREQMKLESKKQGRREKKDDSS
ncbi:hypothetical protein [Cuneatibacter caecimuris]|uniref:Uncharacterized protein n=1 Tax=Cuneatibacter caecimuris TaxID=1796618 RepID=A0A4Q7PMQ8_9FIRM|nr:hypothetical protein [Cuneatibacter caecimuris]RZT01190.1 hypothetical protein EV209_1632 [Cuneatibacter caecimuris]